MVNIDQNYFRKMNVVKMLLHFNMQWHMQVMKDIVRRHKIIVLFILLLLAPTLSSLQFIITFPIKNLIDLNPRYDYVLYSLLFYQGLGLIWLVIHQALFSTSWQKYLLSLPISIRQRVLSEMIMLFINDFILWIPLLFVIGSLMLKHDNHIGLISILIAKSIMIICVLLLLQTALLKKQFKIMAIVLFIDLVIIIQSQLTQHYLQMIVISLMLGISIWMIRKCYISSGRINNVRNRSIYITKNNYSFTAFIPIAITQFKNLMTEYSQQHIVMTLSLIGMIALAGVVTHNMMDNSDVIFASSIFMLINTFMVSNLYSKLEIQRNNIRSYFLSLPISRLKIYYSDLLILGSITLIGNSVIVVIASIHNANGLAIVQYVVVNALSIIYLAINYVPHIKIKQNSMLASLIILPLFVWLNYLIIFH